MAVVSQQVLQFRKRCYKSSKKSVKRWLDSVGDFLARQSPLPDQPVMDPADFPWVPMLEKNYPVILRDLQRVLKYRSALPKLHEIQREQYRISSDDKWKAFVLYGWGHVAEEGVSMCPDTAKIVQQIPGLRSAFFSILAPGAQIPDHRGHVRGLLRGQLALIVPEQGDQCFLRVEDSVLHWEPGKMIVFDDTYRHEVQNNTDQERVVLILHFDRPMNRLGRWVHQSLIAIIRHTPFVKKAVRNHARWQDRFRKERDTQIPED